MLQNAYTNRYESLQIATSHGIVTKLDLPSVCHYLMAFVIWLVAAFLNNIIYKTIEKYHCPLRKRSRVERKKS